MGSFRYPVEADRLASVFEGVLAPEQLSELRLSLAERDRAVENYLSRSEIVFSMAGALVVAISGRYRFADGARGIRVQAELDTAGTSATTIDVYRNGASIGTISLAASATLAVATFESAFGADVDHLRFGVTTVGAGAKELTVRATS